MNTMNRPDFAIAGMGRTGGGSFHRVELEGVSTVDGDLNCYSFKMSGMATVKGSVRAEERFEGSGKLKVEGPVQAEVMKLEGQVTVRGDVSCDVFQGSGFMKVHGDCRANRCEVRGALAVDGLLLADQLELWLEGPFRAEAIRCREIHVKNTHSGALKRLLHSILPSSWQKQLRANHIEGDEIELRETTASLVRGRRVSIGPGCVINRVEYESELIVHPDAIVHSREQLVR
ncbi:hypothetical protein [Paenibacillus albus]|uniref:Polymer-forming cytoskeletal protein n=1 Tax=Paenibacillus albus TaxID=2495582 RepID=A0A3Q8XAC3_9BACL|nr:hypothetical protein [Paenibacillus albus]AZN43222.1 hypothetical protein EJC50_28690 [Paenibacillus albus]